MFKCIWHKSVFIQQYIFPHFQILDDPEAIQRADQKAAMHSSAYQANGILMNLGHH